MNTARAKRFTGSLSSTAIFLAGSVGAALLLFAGHTTYRNHVARQWPTTEGRVVSSRTMLIDASLGRPGDHKEPRAEVLYRYAVAGRQYESANVSYERGIGPKHELYDPSYAVRYPAGTVVRVAYNPADPAEAVIDRTRDPIATVCVGLALLVGFGGYQIWLRRGPPAA